MTARSVAKSTNKPTKNAHRKHGVDDHSITRDSIISTAFDLFREKGYAKASISELARRIGMDPSSLYYYFPSKEALLAEISNPKIEVPTMEELSSFTNSRTVQLYTLIMMDVVQKCELPLDFIDVELVKSLSLSRSSTSTTKPSITRCSMLLKAELKKANSVRVLQTNAP